MAQHTPKYVFYRDDSGALACDIRLLHRSSGLAQRYTPHDLIRSPIITELSAEHRKIIMQLAMHCPTRNPHNLLHGRYGFDLAKAIIDTGSAHWLNLSGKPAQWRSPCKASLDWTINEDQCYTPTLTLCETPDFIFALSPPLCVFAATATLRPVSTSAPDDIANDWVAPRAPMDHATALEFCRKLVARHPNVDLPIPPIGADAEKLAITPTATLRVSAKRISTALQTQPVQTVPIIQLSFNYDLSTLLPSDPSGTISFMKDRKLIQCDRNHHAEAAIVTQLQSFGFKSIDEISPYVPDHAKGRDWFLSPDSKTDWSSLKDIIFPELSRAGWQIEYDADWTIHTIQNDDWYTNLSAKSKGWFELEIGIQIGKTRISLLPIVLQILAQNRMRPHEEIRTQLIGHQIPVATEKHGFILVPGDRILTIIENLIELHDQPTKGEKDLSHRFAKLRLDAWRAAEIGALEQWSNSPWTRPAALKSLTQRLAKVNKLKPLPAPRTLQATLRPYQQWGLAWLQFLRESEFDGILADDMGLGKTMQTLAHLLTEKEAGRLHHPCLIITPTSVIQNWIDEASRFAPSLRLLVSHGTDRKDVQVGIPEADLVLTSYALLRRDTELLQKQPFSLVILDEAQYIKNRQAQTAQIACTLNATRRLCLTGTPMENHLGELWGLFHFLMPGFLGSSETFNIRFRRPIEQDGQDWARQSLSRRLAPFMLRRLKSQVEKELPAKTVSLHRVELSPAQRDLYESVRLAMQSRIRKEIASRGLNRSHITVLDGLLKLRQVCCDPRLVKHDATRDTGGPENSAKLQALLDMVSEMIEDGRKILIFSQFVGMLKLIEAELNTLGIQYSLLTGETKDRATPIKQFQSGETSVFLISLKAGGTGLNLTAADTVIHYDPWWNPATENQATDRAHRIGQTKPIFVYRYVTIGTVEARIQAMQERKQKLADSILQEQKADSVKFTLADIEALFAPLDN